jgi:trk system potassium uptake protein TrkA
MLRRLLPHGAEPEWRDPSGSVRLAEVHVDSTWIGRAVRDLEEASGARVAFLTRYGVGLLPRSATLIQDGDLVHVVMQEVDADRVVEILGKAPEAV